MRITIEIINRTGQKISKRVNVDTMLQLKEEASIMAITAGFKHWTLSCKAAIIQE